jgi:hypothetical protein
MEMEDVLADSGEIKEPEKVITGSFVIDNQMILEFKGLRCRP